MRFRRNPATHDESNRAQPAVGEEERPALEHRLQELAQEEHQARQLFERQQLDSELRLADTEEALAKARMEIESLTAEVDQAKREAEEARKTIKPRAAERIAVVEEALAEARADAERNLKLRAALELEYDALAESEREAREALRQQLVSAKERTAAEQPLAELEATLAQTRDQVKEERAQREDLEQRLESATKLQADARAALEQQLAGVERARAESERSAAEVQKALDRERAEHDLERERLLATKQQLQALVKSEQSKREAQQKTPRETPVKIAEPPVPAPASEEKPPRSEKLEEEKESPAQPDRTREPVPPVLEALRPTEPKKPGQTEKMDQTADGELSESPQDRKGGPVGRRRRRRRSPPPDQKRTCAVCKRLSEGQSPKQLVASGWIVTSYVGLCPDCQREGWQVAGEGGLPFRRLSDRQTST